MIKQSLPLIPLALALAGISIAHADVPSGFRAALVLGNSQYEGFTLPGVEQSLDQVEDALAAQGYRVTRKENLNEKELKLVAEEFAQGLPTGAVAVFYYVGLGANVERLGKHYNLLRPVKTQIENDNDYRSRGLNVNELIETLQSISGSRVNLIFLDACWQSPIQPEKGNIHGGLRAMDVGDDTLAMFAASSETTLPPPKDDAASGLSQALAKHIASFDESIAGACEKIAVDLDQPWFDGATQRGAGSGGIGARPTLPIAESLREGKTPGEGFVNSIGMGFRWCPPGTFTMGSDNTDNAATRDRAPVEVTLTQGFWMGEHEVTQREYYAVARRTVSSEFTTGNNIPYWGATEVKSVSDFCKKLSEIEQKAGMLPSDWEYICPSEAQWEYACRAGSTKAFCYGDDEAQLGEYGNFADNALNSANPDYHWAKVQADDGVAEALAPVGRYRPNAWGLRDMHGNVAEIVADHLLPELPGGKDPLATVEKDGRMQIRGGAWCSRALYCESSFRNGLSGRDKLNYVGFRIALQRVK